jgi:hypothetical protein
MIEKTQFPGHRITSHNNKRGGGQATKYSEGFSKALNKRCLPASEIPIETNRNGPVRTLPLFP